MSTIDMTFPLWGLVIFILWLIAVVAFLLTLRIRHLSAGGSPKDLGASHFGKWMAGGRTLFANHHRE